MSLSTKSSLPEGCDIHALYFSFIAANKYFFLSWSELGFYQVLITVALILFVNVLTLYTPRVFMRGKDLIHHQVGYNSSSDVF